MVRGRRLHRGGACCVADLAGQRGASARLRDGPRRPRRDAAEVVSQHVAGVRLQETAGGGRDADLLAAAGLPQSRARRPASSRLHDARVVSRGSALRDADGGLRRDPAPGGGRSRHDGLFVSRPHGRPARDTGKTGRRRSLRDIRRDRSPGEYRA